MHGVLTRVPSSRSVAFSSLEPYRDSSGSTSSRLARTAQMCAIETVPAMDANAGVRIIPPTTTTQPAEVRVLPKDCTSCEGVWLERSKEAEYEEQERLLHLRQNNISQHSFEIWEYAQRMNDTQRQELALDPDVLLRNFIIDSCTPPTELMETVYNATMQRVPYE